MASISTAIMANSSNGTSTSISADKKTGPCQVCKTPCTLQCSACFSVYYCSLQHQKQDRKNHKKGLVCSPLVLAQDNQRGRYWVASRNIKAGELILKELPAIVSPIASGDLLAICISCCTKLEPPETRVEGASHVDRIRRSCRKCGWLVCGIDCEMAPIHADNECPLFVSRSVKFPVSPPIEMAAAISRGNMYTIGIALIRGLLLKSKNPETWDKIMELQVGNKRAEFAKNSLAKDNIERGHVNIAKAISEEFKVTDLGPQEDWVRLTRILETNQFAIERQEKGKPFESEMSGLYAKGSLFNHSCIPNAFKNISYPPAFELQIRAATDIKKGDMVTINSYEETMLYGTEKRLDKTKLTSGFVCQCARCVDPTELGTYMSAIMCDHCPGMRIMLPSTFQNSEEPYRCQMPGCSNTKTRSSVNSLISKYHREISEDESMDSLVGDALILEDFITRLSGKVLHPNHWLMLKADRGCIRIYDDVGGFDTNPEQASQFLLYAKRILEFIVATSPGISVERGFLQYGIVMAMLSDAANQEDEEVCTMSREDVYEFWTEIYNRATDALKYWQIDVEHTPPENATSTEEKQMKEVVMVARATAMKVKDSAEFAEPDAS